MSEQVEIQLQSDRKLQVIGTEVFDANLPTQLNFKQQKNANANQKLATSTNLNPEEAMQTTKLLDIGNVGIKQYRVKGKSIFDIETKYRVGDLIEGKDKNRFPVKAFNQDSKGIMVLWQAVVGYSKRQLIIEDGQLYITSTNKSSPTIIQIYKLTKLLKFFIDHEQNKIRFVFTNEDQKIGDSGMTKSGKRINKDFQLFGKDSLISIVEKLLLECNILGLEIAQDQI